MEKIIDIKSFIKGINQAVNKELTGIDEAYEAQNLDISNGTLKRTKGYAAYTAIKSPSPIKTLMKYYKDNNCNILASYGDKVGLLGNAAYADIISGLTSSDFDYINYQIDTNSIIILCNGKDNTKVYDGSTIRDLKFKGKDSAAAADNLAPKCRFIVLHKERLYMSGDYANPNRLHFSASFDPDYWDAPVDEVYANSKGGFIDIPTWDGGTIIGLSSLFDDVLVYKNRNIFRLFGAYPGNFSMQQIYSCVNGTIVDKSIASLENRAYWTSTDGIYIFDGVQVAEISLKIKNEFAKVNKAAINSAVGVIYKGCYYLALPEGDSVTNNVVYEYNIKNNNFMIKRGINVNSFLETGDKLLFTDNEGNIYEYNNGSNFQGGAIDAFWQSGAITCDRLDKKKIFKSVHFNASGNGTIRIYVNSDMNSPVYKDIVLTPNESHYKVKLRNKGIVFYIRIENVSSSDFEINSMQFNYELQV